jgi:glutathione S-transferase
MYLCDKYKKHDWYPTDLKEQARVNEYANWQHLNLRITGAMLFRAKVKSQFSYFMKYKKKFSFRLLHLV